MEREISGKSPFEIVVAFFWGITCQNWENDILIFIRVIMISLFMHKVAHSWVDRLMFDVLRHIFILRHKYWWNKIKPLKIQGYHCQQVQTTDMTLLIFSIEIMLPKSMVNTSSGSQIFEHALIRIRFEWSDHYNIMNKFILL